MQKIRLSQKEAAVLDATQLEADLTVDEIRKRTKLRDHTIRYAMKRLEERRVFQFAAFIDLARLGYTLHNVFFSISADSKKTREAFLQELQKAEEIVWVAEFGGDFQYAIEICARHITDVRNVLNRLSEKFGHLFFQKAVSTQFSSHLFSRGYFQNKKVRPKVLSISQTPDTVTIDDLDRTVLLALGRAPSDSHRSIAQRLNIPLSTFELRVKRLKKQGVFKGRFLNVEASAFGYGSYKLLVYVKGVSATLGLRLREFCSRHPNCVSLYECFGAWDFELGVEVESPQAVPQIVQEVYDEFGDELNTIQMLTKFRDRKVILFPGEYVHSKAL